MQLNICHRKIYFHTHILNYIQIDLMYAQEKRHAPTIKAFGI